MDIVDKVNRTRYTIKEILANEWDTSVMPDMSNKEVGKLFRRTPTNDTIADFGVAAGCNFSLKHNKIPSYKIHIIYYNLPDIGKSSSKITKSACDKIEKLYSEERIQIHDSIIVIINDDISESLQLSFDDLNVKLQNNLDSLSLDDSVISEMKKSNLPLAKKHFGTVTLFTINNLTNNVMNHRLVPEQTVIRDEADIRKILEENNCNAKQLPIILKHDIISKYLRLSQGDICKAKRKSIKTGEYDFYRICY